MNISVLVLYYLCEFAGLVMIVGGIWLIYRQKIVLDTAKDKAADVVVEVPFFGKLRTNVPALGLFLLGFVPLIYPIYKSSTDYTRVVQAVTSRSYPVGIYVVVRQKALEKDGKFVISIPILNSTDYEPQIIYVAGGRLADQEEILLSDQKHGVIELQAKSLQLENPSQNVPVQPNVVAPDSRFK